MDSGRETKALRLIAMLAMILLLAMAFFSLQTVAAEKGGEGGGKAKTLSGI